MDVKSGKIYEIPGNEDASDRGLVALSSKEARALRKLPEAQRPAELLQMRALHPLARLPGLTEDDIRKIRNAAKRERRSRR